MSTTDHATHADRLEANCRRLMAERAAMPARGWDTERKRAEKLAALDAELDAWLALTR